MLGWHPKQHRRSVEPQLRNVQTNRQETVELRLNKSVISGVLDINAEMDQLK
jgi:hypothetical protein